MKRLLSWKYVSSTVLDQVRYVSSKTNAVTKIHRQIYCRMYPTLLVQPDGSTINIRYHEPRKIIRLPFDISTLTEAERKKRLEARKPRAAVKVEDDFEDSFDRKKYLRYVKK